MWAPETRLTTGETKSHFRSKVKRIYHEGLRAAFGRNQKYSPRRYEEHEEKKIINLKELKDLIEFRFRSIGLSNSDPRHRF